MEKFGLKTEIFLLFEQKFFYMTQPETYTTQNVKAVQKRIPKPCFSDLTRGRSAAGRTAVQARC